MLFIEEVGLGLPPPLLFDSSLTTEVDFLSGAFLAGEAFLFLFFSFYEGYGEPPTWVCEDASSESSSFSSTIYLIPSYVLSS